MAWDRLNNTVGSKRSLGGCSIVRSAALTMQQGLTLNFSSLSAAQDGFPLVYQHSFFEASKTPDTPEVCNSKYYVMYYFYKAILHRHYHMVDFITVDINNPCYHRMHKYLMQNSEVFIANLARVPRRYQARTLVLVKKFFAWCLNKQIIQYRILIDDLRFQKNCDFVESLYRLLPRSYG